MQRVRAAGRSTAPEPPIRLQRYILRELVAAFALILAIVTAIVGAGLLLQFLHKAPQLGLTALATVLPYVLAEAFPITLPLAFLVACLLTYGRFADDNEFTAFRMGGLHPWLAVVPAVAFGAVLSIGNAWLNTDALPWAEIAKKRILRDQAASLITALEQGSARTLGTERLAVSSAAREADGAFVDAHISIRPKHDGRDGSAPQPGEGFAAGGEIRAERAWLWYDEPSDSLVVRLQNAVWDRDDGVHVAWAENSVAIALDELVSASPDDQEKGSSYLSAAELNYRLAHDPPNERVERGLRTELWTRFGMGLAPLVFGLLGAPLGLWSARGSRASAFLLALLIAMPVYYPLTRIGENLAVEGTLPVPLAVFGADAALAAAGLWFLWRIVRT